VTGFTQDGANQNTRVGFSVWLGLFNPKINT